MTMVMIILGAAVTLGLLLAIYLLFRYRGDSGDAPNSGTYFSTYDGGHDGLGESGGVWGGSGDAGSSDDREDEGNAGN